MDDNMNTPEPSPESRTEIIVNAIKWAVIFGLLTFIGAGLVLIAAANRNSSNLIYILLGNNMSFIAAWYLFWAKVTPSDNTSHKIRVIIVGAYCLLTTLPGVVTLIFDIKGQSFFPIRLIGVLSGMFFPVSSSSWRMLLLGKETYANGVTRHGAISFTNLYIFAFLCIKLLLGIIIFTRIPKLFSRKGLEAELAEEKEKEEAELAEEKAGEEAEEIEMAEEAEAIRPEWGAEIQAQITDALKSEDKAEVEWAVSELEHYGKQGIKEAEEILDQHRRS